MVNKALLFQYVFLFLKFVYFVAAMASTSVRWPTNVSDPHQAYVGMNHTIHVLIYT